MSIRWTEEEAKANGYKQDSKGNWTGPGVSRRHSREVPKLESGARVKAERAHELEGSNEGCGLQGYRIIVTAHCRRHTDPDNLCPKYFIDQLKHEDFRIIPDDSSKFVSEFIKRVKKIDNWEPEITEIEVWKL